jgi:ferredoxin
MGKSDFHIHYVATLVEAEALIKTRKQFWVCNCGCREEQGKCQRSRIDVCLFFRGDVGSSGSGLRKITPAEADGILKEAIDKDLVARPFRNESDRNEIDGICFCCDDCCAYFLNPEEECDRGKFVERTDLVNCDACGTCADRCYFRARAVKKDRLRVTADKCYGCGLCVAACPNECIEMVPR